MAITPLFWRLLLKLKIVTQNLVPLSLMPKPKYFQLSNRCLYLVNVFCDQAVDTAKYTHAPFSTTTTTTPVYIGARKNPLTQTLTHSLTEEKSQAKAARHKEAET